MHQILTTIKALSPVPERGFFRLLWAISEHALRQSRKGKAEEVSLVNDIRQFVSYLNEKYPIEADEIEGYEKNFELGDQIR